MKTLFLACFLVAAALAPVIIHAEGAPEQTVIRAGTIPTKDVAAANFSGNARTDQAFRSVEPARHYGAWVTFEPGSRTAWHIHPLGQTLVVTAGRGVTQQEDKEPTIILPGDVVICPPGVRHWHGAAPDTAMTHLAIGERDAERPTQWFNKLSDAEYQKASDKAVKMEKR